MELWRGNSLGGLLGSEPKLWGGGSGQPVKGGESDRRSYGVQGQVG